MNIGDTKTEYELEFLKSTNKSITTTKELAKQLNLKPKEIEDALLNNELEIIKRYIFFNDRKNVYINTDNEKNAEFIDKKRLEQQILGEQKEENKQRAVLTMKLLWHYCPETRKTAERLAENKPIIAELTMRRKTEHDKSLNVQETSEVNKYFKSMWNEAGTEEFHNAIIKAKQVLQIYDEKGIDSVEDEEARNIILNETGNN